MIIENLIDYTDILENIKNSTDILILVLTLLFIMYMVRGE